MPLPQKNSFTRALLAWYQRAKRDLPWRRTRDPYAIWVSEIMLQQTRVAAVLPYYNRFLERFPDVESLAAAPEPVLLAQWAGLGYYSRARNLQKAAREIVSSAPGRFPTTYEGLRALPGIGDYTASAIASIAFDLPHAAIDGNLLRVLARLTNDAADIASPATRARFSDIANQLLDRKHPGDFNQALMELGATVCLPKTPQCTACPVRSHCGALSAGRQNELPIKSRKQAKVEHDLTLLIVRNGNRILLRQRPADASVMPGFWELPEATDLPGLAGTKYLGEIAHTITFHRYRYSVRLGTLLGRPPKGLHWKDLEKVKEIPVSTAANKALRCLSNLNDASRRTG